MGGVAGLGLLFGLAYTLPTVVASGLVNFTLPPALLQVELGKTMKEEKILDNANATKVEESTCCRVNKIYNFGLLKKPEFFIFIISNMFFSFGVYTVFSFAIVSSAKKLIILKINNHK